VNVEVIRCRGPSYAFGRDTLRHGGDGNQDREAQGCGPDETFVHGSFPFFPGAVVSLSERWGRRETHPIWQHQVFAAFTTTFDWLEIADLSLETG
jgi:hypothetical protein